MALTTAQQDRAIGAVVGSAAGDALGSQYEFGPSHPDSFIPEFGVGAMQHPLGCWTDDTDMAVPILQAIAGDLGAECLLDHPSEAAYSAIAREWERWAEHSLDVGVQTRSVIRRGQQLFAAAGDESAISAANLRQAAQENHEQSGRSGGNGALMRTTPVALIALHSQDDAAIETVARVAADVALLTHWESDNIDACVLWTLAIRHAILTGELSFAKGLAWVHAQDEARAKRWEGFVEEALAQDAHPRDFAAQNGWVVRAFQAALAAVNGADGRYEEAMYRAIRGGNDTDTIAAIAGALAGAFAGATHIPGSWKDVLHGLPNYTCADLERLTLTAISLRETASQSGNAEGSTGSGDHSDPIRAEVLSTIHAGIAVLRSGYVVQWSGGNRRPDGVIEMAWPNYNPAVYNALTEAHIQIGPDFDYLSNWEAIKNVPVADLSREQLGTFLTYLLRGERFSTGHIDHYVQNGNLLEALQVAVSFLGLRQRNQGEGTGSDERQTLNSAGSD